MHRTLVNGYLREARKNAPDIDGELDTAGQVEYLEGLLEPLDQQLRGWDVGSVSAEGTSSTASRVSSVQSQIAALEKAIDLAGAGKTRMGGTLIIPTVTGIPR